jgi:glycerol kinase
MGDSSAPLYLCLDQGGHASRAVIIDAVGDVQKIAFRNISTRRDDARVEHDPAELLASLQEAAAEVSAGYEVCLAGLATQRSSVVCWDRYTGEALSPVLSWQDRRAADWLEEFKEHEARIHAITGLVLSPHYGVSKLVWCLENLPQVTQAQAEQRLMFGPLASWLAGRLCGQVPASADPANASRTLLWDRGHKDWSTELLQLFNVPAGCLPAAVGTRHDWGEITVSGKGIPLAVVTGDQSAALFAFGMPDDATLYTNLGTGAFLQRTIGQLDFDPGNLLASVVYADDDTVISVLEATVNGAGAAINKFADDNGIDIDVIQQHSADWLDAFNDDLLYINSIAGLGSPWWLSGAESCFLGDGTVEAKLAAVLESIAFLLAVNIEAGNNLLGATCSRILVTGGLGRVDPLLQRVADLSGAEVQRAHVTEATVRGLAFLLAGKPQDWPDARTEKTFMPQQNDDLLGRFRRWRSQMPPLAG